MNRIKTTSRYLIIFTLLISLSGCDILRGIVGAVPTQVPTSTPYPTSTPQPGASVTFKITVPANTPSGSSVNLVLPDMVGGTANKTFILTNVGGNVWTTNVPAPLGSLLRYRFQRITGGQTANEVHADGSGLTYRTALVTGNATVEETVAAWNDTPLIADKGRIVGIVRDASSNQGLPGMIVSAGGQQAITGFDGEYTLWNLAANAVTPVTVFAPDGSFRSQMNTAAPPVNGTAFLDFSLNAAKTIKILFVVALPQDTPENAVIKMAGNTLQVGETFVAGPGGSSVAVQRQAVLARLEDGRWATSLTLFEGIDLRYKYTLGSGYLNGELGVDGGPLVRQIILSGDDELIIQDQVISWRKSTNSPVQFSLKVPANTPSTDEVTLQLKLGGAWLDPVAMWHSDGSNWSYTLYNPLDFAGEADYRFCRNYQCGIADDHSTFGSNPAGYLFTPTILPTILQNNVTEWQWWSDTLPPSIIVPAFTPRPGFQTGFELTAWDTADAAYVPAALDAVKATSAGWVRIPVVWDAPSANPPLITFDFYRSLHRADLIAAIRAAQSRGFKVALYPQVRPAVGGPYSGNLGAYFSAGVRDSGWWDGWFREYARFLAYAADVAAFTGADMLYVGDWMLASTLPDHPSAPPDADARWRGVLTAIRRDHYNGPQAFALNFGNQSPAFVESGPPRFTDALDVLDIFYSAAMSPVSTAALAELKAGAAAQLDAQLYPVFTTYNKTILITATYPSTDGSAAACIGIALGGCQLTSKVAPDQPESPQFPIDLNEQELAYEALLQAVAERAWIGGFYGYGYNVPVALRDKYFSPRGKPAEVLLASWFPRLK